MVISGLIRRSPWGERVDKSYDFLYLLVPFLLFRRERPRSSLFRAVGLWLSPLVEKTLSSPRDQIRTGASAEDIVSL